MAFIKKYWIAIVVIIIILIVAIMYMRNKKKKQMQSAQNGAPQNYQNVFTVGRFDHKAGNSVAVTIGERPVMGSIVEGDTVRIENAGTYNGTYTVQRTWEDGKGKLGAIFLDIPGTELLPDDTEERGYAGVGKIYHL